MQHNRPFGIVDCAIIVGTVLVLVGTCWLAELNDIHAEDTPSLFFADFIAHEPQGHNRLADTNK